jgi:hypothetical protein
LPDTVVTVLQMLNGEKLSQTAAFGGALENQFEAIGGGVAGGVGFIVRRQAVGAFVVFGLQVNGFARQTWNDLERAFLEAQQNVEHSVAKGNRWQRGASMR